MLKAFCANFQTVAGRLLMAGTLISINACTQYSQPYYGAETTANRTNTGNVWHRIMPRLKGSADAYAIPLKDRDRLQRCVFFALENLNLGETCRWISPDSSARGEVKVVFVYPSGSKMCHVFYTNLQYRGQSQNWQDTACYSGINGDWHFKSKT